jgi:phosphopantetheinyl transferase
VDLRDPENQPDAIHARFDERVFDPAERACIREADSPHRVRWALWAAKESAYKVARRMDGRIHFHPQAFSVRIPGRKPAAIDSYPAEVSHATCRFEVDIRSTDDWVHAVASPRAGTREEVGWKVDDLPLTACPAAGRYEASERVRRLARSAIASALSLVPSDLVVAAAAKRAPEVWWRGRKLAVDLSMSHHGRFIACAWRRVSGIMDLASDRSVL